MVGPDEQRADGELLPPPTPLNHAKLSLVDTLRRARETAKRRAINAQTSMVFVALMLALVGGPIAYFMSQEAFDGGDIIDWVLMLAGAVAVLFALLVLTTNSRLFNYYYRLAAQRLVQPSEFLLYADEDLLRRLHSQLPGPRWGATAPKAQFSSLAEQLECGAFHLDNLRRLARNPEQGLTGLWLNERARGLGSYFDNAAFVIGGCLTSGIASFLFVPIILPLVAGPHIALASRAIRANAYLAALIDCYLEPGDTTPTQAAPRCELRGWWARTAAPWRPRA